MRWLELGLTLVAFAAVWLWPRAINSRAARVETLLQPVLQRGVFTILFVMAVAVIARAALLPWLGPPVPRVHDEYSLLLQAQTFASGALSTSVGPFWRHFESFHVNVLPTYASIYFPGRSFPLLVGLVLTGSAWLGVWLSVVLLCGGVTWMLLGWTRPGLALAGGLIVVIRFAVLSYWINSFWGGAFTALGGVLVIGALPRILAHSRWRDGAALGVGALILMTSRPYEGVLLCAPIALYLAWHHLSRIGARGVLPVLRVGVPAALCLAFGAGSILSYNLATTGNSLETPYDLNRTIYATAPALLANPALKPVSVPDERFRRFYEWEADFHARRSSVLGLARSMASKIYRGLAFYAGPALTLPLLFGVVALFRKGLIVWVAGLIVLVGFLAESWDFPHYVSPAFGVVILAVMLGFEWMRDWRGRGAERLLALSRALPLVGAVSLTLPVAALVTDTPLVNSNHYDAACCAIETKTGRSVTEATLKQLPGRDLVFVRYMADDFIHTEWVYNEPDLDRSDVIWARDLGRIENGRLLARYPGRRTWLIDGLGRSKAPVCIIPRQGPLPSPRPVLCKPVV